MLKLSKVPAAAPGQPPPSMETVIAVPASTLGQMARRPPRVVLGSERGNLMPELENALQRYLAEVGPDRLWHGHGAPARFGLGWAEQEGAVLALDQCGPDSDGASPGVYVVPAKRDELAVPAAEQESSGLAQERAEPPEGDHERERERALGPRRVGATHRLRDYGGIGRAPDLLVQGAVKRTRPEGDHCAGAIRRAN